MQIQNQSIARTFRRVVPMCSDGRLAGFYEACARYRSPRVESPAVTRGFLDYRPFAPPWTAPDSVCVPVLFTPASPSVAVRFMIGSSDETRAADPCRHNVLSGKCRPEYRFRAELCRRPTETQSRSRPRVYRWPRETKFSRYTGEQGRLGCWFSAGRCRQVCRWQLPFERSCQYRIRHAPQAEQLCAATTASHISSN
jgi:hypothetical protein